MKIEEIMLAQELVQPTSDQLEQMAGPATTPYKDSLWYHEENHHLLIVRRLSGGVVGLVKAVAYHNPRFDRMPDFVVPENLYSWANDQGETALMLLKAVLDISPLPVVSDIEMTQQAQRFLQKQISRGTLRARTLDLNTGDVTPYDPTVWTHADNYRVLILNQPFGTPINNPPLPRMETVWNHAERLKLLGKGGRY